jgi:hypothetical protein
MSRLDTDRRIESALSIFVVAVVLGVIAEIFSRTGQSLVWWLMRTQGWSSGRIATFSWAWSLTSGLNFALATLTSEGFGGAAASVLATLFFIVALARAARALGDLEVRRRARIALFAYTTTLGLTTLGFLVAVRNAARVLDATLQLLIAFAFLAALVSLGIYLWFLAAATRMPGFVAVPDPVDAPPAPKSQ